MSTTCIIDNVAQQKLTEYVEKYRSGCGSSGACLSPVGLLIGQNADDKMLVVDTLPSQEPTDDGSATHSQSRQNAGKQKQTSLLTVSEGWLGEHARQITQLLCGGFHVVGIFTIAQSTADVRKSVQSICPALLHNMAKVVGKQKYEDVAGVKTCVKLLYMYDMQVGKFSCRSVDASDVRSEAKPVDTKIQAIRQTFHSINTMFTLSYSQAVGDRESKRNVGKQVMAACLEHCRQLKNAHYTFNNLWRSGDSLLTDICSHSEEPQTAVSPKDKRGKSKKVEVVGHEFVADIFLPYERESEGESESEGTLVGSSRVRCGGEMVVDGSMQIVAYVHNKATVDEAVAALYSDIRRSLSARCTIISEDESLYEHETAPNTRYEFPLRSFIALPSTSSTANLANLYSYYDYYELLCEDEESCGEVLSAVSELLYDSLSVEQFVKSSEVLATSSISPVSGSDHGSEYASSEHGSEDEHIKVASSSGSLHTDRPNRRYYYVVYGAGMVGAVVALTVAYLYSNPTAAE